jgi:hypothetical protein
VLSGDEAWLAHVGSAVAPGEGFGAAEVRDRLTDFFAFQRMVDAGKTTEKDCRLHFVSWLKKHLEFEKREAQRSIAIENIENGCAVENGGINNNIENFKNKANIIYTKKLSYGKIDRDSIATSGDGEELRLASGGGKYEPTRVGTGKYGPSRVGAQGRVGGRLVYEGQYTVDDYKVLL